ncbi:MAG: futalosine hydrolase [Bacteroidales bacterium]|jgi:futalosine hydrolase|nr:futalosine hydrolase [Bacteroidales bacterium]
MPLRILVVSATQTESEILKAVNGIDLIPLVTGVGAVATAWTLTRYLCVEQLPDLAVNIGIAGSFNSDIQPGEVVMPVSDCFADAGAEDRSGFLSLSEAGLQDPDELPFRSGRIIAENRFVYAASAFLRPVSAITVNTATGSLPTIDRLSEMYHPDIETMEGAAFFYVCSREKIPFMSLRAVSNMVEPRDREKWNIGLALANLSVKLNEILLLFK